MRAFRLNSGENAAIDIGRDPETARRQRTRRHYRYNVLTLPLTRFLGFNAVIITALLLARYALGSIDWDVFRPLIIAVEAYCLLSWAALRVFWLRLQPSDLQRPFLAFDLLVWAALIYASGAERSWLYFVLIIRVADQSYTSFRRALIFAHLAPIVYLLMLGYVQLVDNREVFTGMEAAKLFTLYGACLYLALIGRTASALRERTNAAIRLAKDLIGQLEENSRLLQEKSVELEASTLRAEAASGAKSRFLANMSHELRTPLNAIIGYTEMLQEEDETSGGAVSADLENIRVASRHLLSLIDDVLDIAKIEAGRMSLHVERFDVAPLIEEVVKTAEPLMRRNRNRFDVHLSPELGNVSADVMRVRQMLLNVLSNASKFTEGGVITLRARRERGVDGETLILSVGDTGIGMTEEEQSRLFQPFSQADPSTTRRYGGSGLGLVLTKRFAEQMGGTIHVESAPGVGTTFTIRIPCDVSVPGAGELEPSGTDGQPGPSTRSHAVSDARP